MLLHQAVLKCSARMCLLTRLITAELGLLFFRQMNSFNYGGVSMVILAILLLIMLGEIISHYLRKAVT